MNERIGLFGGTFNPIHFGHLNLALELKEKKNLTQVWFIPSLISPLRLNGEALAPHHRLKMLELAICDLPEFKICSLELDRPPPSFTIDTIRDILSKHPNQMFWLLLGEDCLIHFHKWKQAVEIVKNIPLLIGTRPHFDFFKYLSDPDFNTEIALAIDKGRVKTREFGISATEIRERIKNNLYCNHLLPSKVLDYIYENQLYSNSPFIKK